MNVSNGNVMIANVTVTAAEGGSVVVGFDALWADSWRFADGRRGNNWDAAWIFVKYECQITHAVRPLHGPAEADLIASHLDAGDAGPLLASSFRSPGDALLAAGDHHVTVTRPGKSWGLRQTRRTPLGSEATWVEILTVTREGDELLVRSTGSFKHARVAEVLALPPGGTIDVPEDGRGLFLYRGSPGEGEAVFRGIQIRCEPADERFPMEVSDRFAIVGIQMVLVPEGPFQLGDPQGPKGPAACFYDSRKSGANLTYEVTSEDAIPIASGTPLDPRGLTYHAADAIGNPGDLRGPIPQAFPKGYQAFYLMRSHVTEEQYRIFINTLPGPARTQRFSYWYGEHRYNILMLATGKRVALRPNRACNWLSWMDGAAFACWAGLRPMTELEFEKACRGPLPAVSGEYAWGSTNLVRAEVIVGDENGRMLVQGNANYGRTVFVGGDGSSGPVPDDAFDASLGTGDEHGIPGAFGVGPIAQYPAHPSARGQAEDQQRREDTGASYYGVMGLSGNLWDYCVTAGNSSGRAFTGNHGTGALNHFGNLPGTTEDRPGGDLGWPGISVWGVGYRGGSWYTVAKEIRIADRSYGAGLEGYTSRSDDTGFRCARTAPRASSKG